MTITDALAAFACSTETAPPAARSAAIRATLDLIGVASAGSKTRAGAASLSAARSIWGAGQSNVWFSNERLSVAGAAFVNATYASIMDLDDGHRGAAGHPGAAIIPAVLATAQAMQASADRVLTAIAIGYEIGIRVAAARDFRTLQTTDTGLWCGYGVAAAAGWLRRLPAVTIAHAMAIASQTAPGQFATGWTRVGHTVKEGIAWATVNGLIAVDLAVAGHTGPVDILDDRTRYDQTALVSKLGQSWQIQSSYFKLYSCCRWAHAAIDAVLALQQQHGLSTESIDSVDIATFGRALSLNNETAPRTNEGAQYSVPFCVALALVRGAGALLPLRDDSLSDPKVIALAKRVRLSVDSGFDRMFPIAVPARVTIIKGGTKFSTEVIAPKGEPTNPLSQMELEQKFDTLTRGVIPAGSAEQLKNVILQLNHKGEIAPLMTALHLLPERQLASTMAYQLKALI